MTSIQLQADIEKLKSRVKQVETVLEAPQSLDDGLKLQREHSDLQAYLQRLEAQYTKALADEDTSKKKQVRAELDAELARTAAEHADISAQIAHSVRELVPMIRDTCEGVKPLRGHLRALERQHSAAYLNRYGNWPDGKDVLRKSASFIPLDADAETELRVLAFALELIDNETTGHGTKLSDVYKALAARSAVYGV